MTLINFAKPSTRLLDYGRNRILDWLGNNLIEGNLVIRFPDGSEKTYFGEKEGPSASISFQDLRCLGRVITKGALGFGEAYIAGEWTSSKLANLIELGICNEKNWAKVTEGRLIFRVFDRLIQLTRFNSRYGSRRNIAHHYDLGNPFYAHWLDAGMTYSSALFSSCMQTLEAGQEAKYKRICDLLQIKQQDRLLEIGCGWGGFAEYAAQKFGCQITGITLSSEQLAYAIARRDKAGLQDKIDYRLQDYRDVKGQFDRIISIEMFEAVGENYWPSYFECLKNCLTPQGKAVLQIITIEERRFAAYRRDTDFIQKYIFPGGLLPSAERIKAAAEMAGLSVLNTFFFGGSYARTLQTWNTRFQESWPAIAELGFDEKFRRMFEFYFAYCEAGFRSGTIDVGHYLIEPSR